MAIKQLISLDFSPDHPVVPPPTTRPISSLHSAGPLPRQLMPEQSRLSVLLTELKRRRVFRVAAVYGGVSFVLVQIIDGTFEVMGIPAWVSRLAITLLALGFPLAVGLAWVFDITPEGIVRTDRVSTDSGGKGKAESGSGKPLTSKRALSATSYTETCDKKNHAVQAAMSKKAIPVQRLPDRTRSALSERTVRVNVAGIGSDLASKINGNGEVHFVQP